jgi:Tol biopolymer transport system component
MSDDGRFVVFVSNAALLPGQSPGLRSRIYVRDRVTGATELVDTSTAGVESNSDSYRPSITADGRYVVFASAGTNLAPGPSIPGSFGVYRKDRWLGTTIRVDLTPAGAVSDAGLSSWPGIDDSGRYVVFRSDATNLVAGDTNGQPDVFRRDLTTGTTVRVSVSSSGAQATGGLSTLPSISGDGRFVLFESAASNLVPGDTNNAGDAFLRDLDAGTTTRVSVATGGVQAIGGGTSDSALDDSGRYVAFRSSATNLVPGDVNGQADVFVHDVLTNRTTRVSIDSNGLAGNGPSSAPSISDGGRSVSFVSTATNLVAGDTNTSADVFVHDRATGTTTRVSVTTAGAQATGNAQRSVISADGRAIAFDTPASLVAGDTNGILDVYVRDLGVAALFG